MHRTEFEQVSPAAIAAALGVSTERVYEHLESGQLVCVLLQALQARNRSLLRVAQSLRAMRARYGD
jgi:AcrR family transcriptional regulator